MKRAASRGMTLIELLTVIAIIMAIMALAIPNFAGMLRAQKWSAATSALQNALLRCRTLAVTERRDHSLEFRTNADNSAQYFRLEVESAVLESLPNMEEYLHVTCNHNYFELPMDWVGVFVSGGGVQTGESYYSDGRNVHFSYPAPLPKYDVSRQDWRAPNEIKDNLRVDENIFLPYNIMIDYTRSLHLMNYDKPPSGTSDMPQYGWDYTKDLRFNMTGTLVQAQNPEIVLKLLQYANRTPEVVLERMRLQVLRSTARLRTLSGM